MRQVFFLIIGGSLGTLARYFTVQGIQSRFTDIFPWGTLVVNLSGAFLIGFLFVLFDESFLDRNLRGLLTVGFLGAYTTFSTFSIETLNLLRDGEIGAASLNMLMTNGLGILCTVLGLYAGKILLKTIKG